MNIWLALLTVIAGFILLRILFMLILEMIFLVKESHTIKIYDSRTDRIELLTDIYINASNIYTMYLQKGFVLADYAYLVEVAIYGLVKELGGDTTTLLQKIQQFSGKDKGQQETDGNYGFKRTPPKKDLPNKAMSVDEMLDQWEREHPGWRDEDKKNKGKGNEKI